MNLNINRLRESIIREDSGASKKAWQSRDRGAGAEQPQGGQEPYNVDAPQVNQALADALTVAGQTGNLNQTVQTLTQSGVFNNATPDDIIFLANDFRNHAAKYPDEGYGSTIVSNALYSMVPDNYNDGNDPTGYEGNIDGLEKDFGGFM